MGNPTQNTITYVILLSWETPHFSQNVMEYLNEQFPTQWTEQGCLQNWLLQSTNLTPTDFYEKYAV